MNEITFGVHLPIINFHESHRHSREQILLFAERAEKLGYDSLSDHVVFNTSWLDAVVTLSAVAGTTSKIKLGTSILNIVIRNPIVSARTLSSIDILSSGRLQVSGPVRLKRTTTYVEYPMKIDGKDSTRLYRYFRHFGIRSLGKGRTVTC
jgi:Luciferase-like monooxygenase